jgi:flap endonuclease-1
MGIKYLNKYLLTKCSSRAIFRTSIQRFGGKTIVVDSYIYLYKFLSEDRLIDNFHKMVTLFLKYNITPIFIFDGKPPIEKRPLLQQRKEKKKEAENKYKEIIDQIEHGLDNTEQMATQLALLRKQFLKVDQKHVQIVKTILTEYNVCYIDAAGESDQLCVEYVRDGKAWGCLTDDMDMFVYGVPYVLREINLEEETVNLYILEKILQELRMSMHQFRQILILSGTDYNIHHHVSLYETLKWFQEYKRHCTQQKHCIDFYDWLCRYTKYIKNYSKLMDTYKMFVDDTVAKSAA